MALSVHIDEADSSRLIFSHPVTLAEAITYLWRTPPDEPNALSPDPKDHPVHHRQRRFIIDKSHMDVVFSLQPDWPTNT